MLRRAFLATAGSAVAVPLVTIEGEIMDRLAELAVPGAVIGELRGGKLDSLRCLGVAETQTTRAVQPNTVFQAASLTKQIIAHVTFQFVREGKLDLAAPISQWCPELNTPQTRSITLKHLLSHSSGFPNWRFEKGAALTPSFTPGTAWRYSGEGYVLLQRMLEQVGGKGIQPLVNDLVFAPLGMKSSSLVWRADLVERAAYPHHKSGEPIRRWLNAARQPDPRWLQRYEDYSEQPAVQTVPNAAYSLLTTGEDYARFLAAAIRNPLITSHEVRIDDRLAWGLGWGIERHGGRTFLWQWGDNPGFKNVVFAEPSAGDAVFVFTNSDHGAAFHKWAVKAVTSINHPATERF